jgi:hypothetical protein
MGMKGNYLRVSKKELEEYINDSRKLEERVYSEKKQEDKNLIDVDKCWEGIFYALTGETVDTAREARPPLAWTLLPPQEVDPNQDMGYGPATYTTIEQTKEISDALSKITAEELESKYDGKRMDELNIYPEGWDDDESLPYLVEYFTLLKNFYTKASDENQAVIVFVN